MSKSASLLDPPINDNDTSDMIDSNPGAIPPTQPSIRMWSSVELVAKREVLPMLATRARAPDRILVICDPVRSDILEVLQDQHATSSQHPFGHVRALAVPDRFYPKGFELEAQMQQSFDKIVCLGLLNLVQVVNDPDWLPSWKMVLRRGGFLTIELGWLSGCTHWRDVAQRYDDMMAPLGFSLVAINGCVCSLGTSSQKVEKVDMRARYTNLAYQLAKVDGDKYANMCRWLEEQAKIARLVGIQSSHIYATFTVRDYGTAGEWQLE